MCLKYVEFFKGALDKFNIIPNFFPKKSVIFIPLQVLAWVKTACQVLSSRLTYFWRNMNISSIFYFSKSTSINTQYSSLWGTLEMMLFTKYLIKWKRIGRISWNFRYWFDFKSSIELGYKKIAVILVQCPFKIVYCNYVHSYNFVFFWRTKSSCASLIQESQGILSVPWGTHRFLFQTP